MDPENDHGDQNEGEGQGQESRAPRSVREGLGADKGRKARRSGRRGRRGRSGPPGGPAPASEVSSPTESSPILTPRIGTGERVFEAEGREWSVRVIGSSAVPGRSDASVRILELAFAEGSGGSPEVGTGYLAVRDLAEASDEDLVSLLARIRHPPARERKRSGKGSGGRGRRSRSRPQRSDPPS